MKNFTVLLYFLIVTQLSFSQADINTTFASQMETMFQPLNKSFVPHGILLDYGMEFTNVPAFNGTLTDSTYTNLSTIKQIYNTLLSSRIQNVSTGFVTPQTFDTNLKNNRAIGVIALTGLYFKYGQFIDDATTNNKLTYSNGKFYDKYVNGNWQNPYVTKQTFAITPAIKRYKGLDFQVKLPSDIFYSNYQAEVQSIQIDFDNGSGYVTIPFNQDISVSYTTEGVKTWKYKINLTNNTTLYNQSRIKIEEGLNTVPFASGNPPPTQNGNNTSNLYSESITATKAYQGSYGRVNLTIDDLDNDGIRNPLIVAEGFDLGIILEPENASGSFDYGNFRNFVFEGGTELRAQIWNNNREYDIIYIDWENGIDYLQRNAFALQEVIEWVNQQKANNGSTEQNVVLGQSMGGVIARYALADMEENNEVHDTRLYVSHDAPQQGANIPISLQYMYRHITNQYIQSYAALYGGDVILPLFNNGIAGSDYLSILDAPASRQLIKNSVSIGFTINNSFHDSFYSELKNQGLTNSGGYPVNSRNIAISNGSECGKTQNFNAGEDLINYQYRNGLSFWGDLLSLVYNPLGGIVGGSYIDADLYGVAALGLIPGHSEYNVELQAKTIPYGSGNQIYKGRVSYTKKILWLFNVTIDITNVQKNQPSGVLPFDSYGGGFYNVNNFLDTNNLPVGLYLRDRFGFIPTSSALDIGGYNFNLNDDDYLGSYVGGNPPLAPKNSPFINFSTEFDFVNPNIHNNQHISFNTRNGDWLAAELIATNIEVTDCSFVCDNGDIIGFDRICTGSEIYTVPSGGDSYQWSVFGNAATVTSSTNTNTVTIARNGTNSGWVTLNVQITSVRCGITSNSPIMLEKQIYIGTPLVESVTEVPVTTTGLTSPIAPIDSCDDIGLQLNIAPSNQEVTDVEWQKVTTNYQWTHGNDEYVIIKPTCNGIIKFEVRVKNNCGWSPWQEVVYNVTNCNNNCSNGSGSISSNDFLIYPLPADTSLTVKLKNEPIGLLQNGDTLNIKIYNNFGWLVYNYDAIATQTAIDVSSYMQGIYTLALTYNGQPESHQISIN